MEAKLKAAGIEQGETGSPETQTCVTTIASLLTDRCVNENVPICTK